MLKLLIVACLFLGTDRKVFAQDTSLPELEDLPVDNQPLPAFDSDETKPATLGESAEPREKTLPPAPTLPAEQPVQSELPKLPREEDPAAPVVPELSGILEPRNSFTQQKAPEGFRITAEPYSVPVTKKHRMFAFTTNRGYYMSPKEIDGSPYSFKAIYGTEKANQGFMLSHNWFVINTDFLQLGPQVGFGYAYTIGTGKFNPSDDNPNAGVVKGTRAREPYRFNQFPVWVGLGGKVAALRYIQPYGSISGLAMFIYEYRLMDNEKEYRHRGAGYGFTGTAGIGFWMNWMERAAAWFLDRDWEINDVYATVEYREIQTFPPIRYSTRFAHFGLTFEY